MPDITNEDHDEYPHVIPIRQPGSELLNRREFLETVAGATAAAALAATGLASEHDHRDALPHGKDYGKEEDMSHHNIAEIVEPYLQRDGKLLAAIKEAGGWQKFVELHAGNIREKAFYPKGTKKAVGCMDEGDDKTEIDGSEVHLIRMAGSGILDMDLDDLLGDAEFDPLDHAYLDRLADTYIQQDIFIIQGHGGCGAGTIALEKHLQKKLGRKLTPEEKEQFLTADAVNAFVQEFSQKLAETKRRKLIALGRTEDAAKVRVHFKPITQLSRPESTHVAQVIYYDGTNAFRTSSGVLPAGFLVSAQSLSPKAGSRTVDLAKAISFGGHGPGELLSGERPLRIVTIGHPTDPAFSEAELLKRAKEWHASLPEDQRQLVVIESFVAPLQQSRQEVA